MWAGKVYQFSHSLKLLGANGLFNHIKIIGLLRKICRDMACGRVGGVVAVSQSFGDKLLEAMPGCRS